jgi:DNA-binding response OmpR family regulator
LQTYNVLVIEDDIEDFFLVQEAIVELEADIYLKLDKYGEHTLKNLNQTTRVPEIIILDFSLPVLNAVKIIRYIRDNSRYDQTKIIVHTESTYTDDRDQVIGVGANYFIRKEFSCKNITNVLKSIIESTTYKHEDEGFILDEVKVSSSETP